QSVELMIFQWLSNDQRREMVNSQQRYAVSRKAFDDAAALKGSMIWKTKGGADYLIKSSYGGPAGIRRQKSLGLRSPRTAAMKRSLDVSRAEAKARLAA